MTKFVKQKYYSKNGEKKTSLYHINIPKKVVDEAKINPDMPVYVYSKDNKVIIQQEN